MAAVKFKRSDCAILPLVLKAYWFNMIACGGKREEYRLATGYWQRRLWRHCALLLFRHLLCRRLVLSLFCKAPL